MPEKRQREEVAKAVSRLKSDLAAADLNIIGLHASHLLGSIPIFPCSSACLATLSPDICITLLDDVYSCRKMLERGGYPFRYSQLLNWRQIECGIADYLAVACGVENIYLAAKHPSVMLYRLLFEPRRPRLYSASQITNVRRDLKARAEIEKHRRRIHKEYVVFDPLTVDDRILVNDLPQGAPQNEVIAVRQEARWPCSLSDLGEQYESLVPEDASVFPVSIGVGEAEELHRPDEMSSYRSPIDAQITHRDFRYIDQADAVGAFRPRFMGHESGGVAAEKSYAAGSGGKPVVEYTPPEDVRGQGSKPFSTPLPGPFCQDLRTFYERLQHTAEQEALRRHAQRTDCYNKFESFRDQLSGKS
jgi:adenylate kinase